jgi:hypothetical protein
LSVHQQEEKVRKRSIGERVLIVCAIVQVACSILYGTTGARFVVQNPGSSIISLETGWQAGRMIPVRVFVSGIVLTLWMDENGRVYAAPNAHATRPGNSEAGQGELCRIDANNGRLWHGDTILNGDVYERSPLRTRIRLNNLPCMLLLDLGQEHASVCLSGIELPVYLHVGPTLDGKQEMRLGEGSLASQGKLVLAATEGRIYRSDEPPWLSGQGITPVCWAERTKEGR